MDSGEEVDSEEVVSGEWRVVLYGDLAPSLTVLYFTKFGSIAYLEGEPMASATLSSKFQLSIPKAVREELHLQAGQKFAVITKGDIISLVPIPDLGVTFFQK